MKKYLIALTPFLLLFCSCLLALNRDYKADCDKQDRYQDYYNPYCSKHAPNGNSKWIPSDLINLIPAIGKKCCKCENSSIYLGYFDPDFKKYRTHLVHQLKYNQKNTQCSCYWPEYSSQAAQINDEAYLLFKDLITHTALSNLLENEENQKNFIKNPGWFLNKHGLSISFIAQQFRFSDYYHICKDIEDHASANYNKEDAAKIKDKLEDILEALYPKFLSLYIACQDRHPNQDIEQEIRLMKLLVNDISALDNSLTFPNMSVNDYFNNKYYDMSEFIISNLQITDFPIETENKGISIKRHNHLESFIFDDSANLSDQLNIAPSITTRTFSSQSQILLEQGTLLNSLLLYKNAIDVLTQSIKINSLNRDAYIERAMAYFETNQIQLALKDYEKAKQITIPLFKTQIDQTSRAIYLPKNKTDFANGLIKGTFSGAHGSVKEMIPSILSCYRGILHGLWAFVSSPSEVTEEMINAAYAIGEYISNHNAFECLACVIPEIKDISLTWHNIDDYTRGKKIGYVIGKYGLEIFAPIVTMKGIAKLRALKRANTCFTIEICTRSQSKQAKIIEKSAEFAAKRETAIQEALASNYILIKTRNTYPHIMQECHHWEKVIQSSGNKKEDFKKVILLLEENKILDPANIKGKPVKFPRDKPAIIRTDYEKIINDHKVVAVFETYIESKETFLKDAWVVTKP